MKKLAIFIVFSLLSATLFTSCLDKNDTTTTYSEALVTALSFASNDSFPGLAEASFTIITATDTGMIYNKDSLRFGTMLDSVVPYLAFNHTPSYAIFYTDSCGKLDTVLYSGSDTINFIGRPTRLYVMSSDETVGKWYDIYVNVHQVDPDLFVWERLNEGIFELEGADSKALLLNQQFLLFVNNGFQNQLYTSSDAIAWEGSKTVGVLPDNCKVRNIMEAEGTLYYAEGDQLYTSTDGATWTTTDYASASFSLVNMLYYFNDSIWAITQRKADSKLQLANMPVGGTLTATGNILPDNFPVSDFSTSVFASASDRRRAMIIGGYDIQGNSLNTRWNIEFLQNYGYHMADFSVEQAGYESLTGTSLIWYNNTFYLFGGVNPEQELRSDMLYSDDEGVNWEVPDTLKNRLPETYESRRRASVFVDDQSYIYIIGGRSRSHTFSDVYRGRLNCMTFKDRD